MIEQYIPLLNIGPGTQPEDEDVLEYISMPQGMATHVAPQLPEPEEIARHPGARRVLQELLDLLRQCGDDRTPRGIDLRGLDADERALLDQLLGEGEVSVRVGEGEAALRVQESIFAGIWRLVGPDCDRLEVGAAPALLRPAALAASHAGQLEASRPVPAGVMNAPSILTELADRCRSWQPGQPAHVINLTLLPLSPDDVAFLDACLGAGPVLAHAVFRQEFMLRLIPFALALVSLGAHAEPLAADRAPGIPGSSLAGLRPSFHQPRSWG